MCGNDEFRVDLGYFKKIRCKKTGVTCAPWSDINEEKDIPACFQAGDRFFRKSMHEYTLSRKRDIYFKTPYFVFGVGYCKSKLIYSFLGSTTLLLGYKKPGILIIQLFFLEPRWLRELASDPSR